MEKSVAVIRHMHARTRTHARTHARTHTHTHVFSLSYMHARAFAVVIFKGRNSFILVNLRASGGTTHFWTTARLS